VARDANRTGENFSGGEWIPGAHQILVRRVTETDPWVSGSHPQWAVLDASTLQAVTPWRAVDLYPRDLQFFFSASPRPEVLVENTVEGAHSLFVLDSTGLKRSDRVADVPGSSSLFSFSADLGTMAFMNESLTRPPEVWVRRVGARARRMTHLNDAIAEKVRYRAQEVTWASTDGVAIKGWLLTPPPNETSAPWALLTHVHGGPAFPYPDAFAPYFDYWPYPFELLGSRGIAVFVPNYRGTHTYGRRIAEGGTAQAVEDIASGIQSLVAKGTADANRLGISGHSHGAWLGPLAMARKQIFRAGSFAEGLSNNVVMYELMSENANREIHDPIVGVSLYDAPERYIAESPGLHFAGVTTASLFEGGAMATALYMLGYPKAARRAGMPAEFIIYPKTGHNLAIPRLQREAAQRNLDWFEFWLKDRENADSQAASQYARWRKLRAVATR
jgi:dipeptidyl aminopeptidase/acylaminoacyl peptidase